MGDPAGRSFLVLGCGYLGVRLVATACAAGWRVKAVSRNADALRAAKELGAETFCGMIDGSAWHAFAGSDVARVVNCVSSAGGGLAGYHQSYVLGNQSLAQWAKSTSFWGRCVYTSSVSVYPHAEGALVDESSAEPPENERGRLVLESEWEFLHGLEAARPVVLRLAGLYGPGRHLMLDSIRRAAGPLAGRGDYYLNLVRIEDVVAAVWACLDRETLAAATFNVVDDAPSLREEMAAWLAARLELEMPRFAGGSASGGARRLEPGERPANRRVSNARLKAETGWRPAYPTFREGFEDLLLSGA